MSIPNLKSNGELPPGEHQATLSEVEKRYGKSSAKRKDLMKKLKKAASNMKSSGVKTIWINGSFVTNKEEPNDIDGCWDVTGVNVKKIDPVFLAHTRTKMKAKYGLDFFMAHIVEMGSGLPFPKFFQKNREGNSKGIIVVNLS